MFPTAVRGQAAAIARHVDWLANFALIEVFPAWQNAIGLAWVMVCFAGLCALAIAFVVPVPARDQGPVRRGDRPPVRAPTARSGPWPRPARGFGDRPGLAPV